MTTSITYPRDAWLMDTQRGKVGQFMHDAGGLIYLRPVSGGKEWPVKPKHVRHATLHERQTAGVTLDQEAERQRRIFRVGPVAVVRKDGGPSC
ncbi:hypothetical protein ACFY2W_29745 [Streptomyces sp. NPDC001262]|uniref:hypothetical protein n=1 Tax=unclassified Streptomyces TaxID=2593676 RepID=UPI0036C3B52A